MRLSRLWRRPHEVRRPLLSRLTAVHHLRPRGRLPVPLGHYPRNHRSLRLLLHDGVPGRADGRLHLRMEEGRPGMGVIPNTSIISPNGTAARAGVEGGAAGISDNDPYFKAL